MNRPNRVIYDSRSTIRNPQKLFQQMFHDLLSSRELAWRLFIRDINAKYRQSFLGFFWAFIPPVVTAISFNLAKTNGVINVSNTQIPYPAYVMFSMTLWQTFAEALNAPIQAVISAKPMLVRINFPREALIIAKLGEVFLNFGIKLFLLIGIFVWFKIPVTWYLLLTPIPLIHLVALGTFIGLLLAPIGALYQDVSKGLTFIVGLWLFLTPVVYPLPDSGIFGNIVKLNPVTPLLVMTRQLATAGTITNSWGFWVASLIAIIGLLIGWIFYRLAMPFVVERMSS